MKIEDISEAALGREDDKDLYDLRLRCVNFYKKHFAGTRRRTVPILGLRHDEMLTRYSLLIKELKSRGLKYTHGHEIDKASARSAFVGIDVRDLEDVVVEKDFVYITGSFAKNPQTAKTVDVTIGKMKAEMLEGKISQIIKKRTEKEAVIVHVDVEQPGIIIPLFELVLKPKVETLRKKLKVLPAVIKQSGMDAENLKTRFEERKERLRRKIIKPEVTETLVRIPVGRQCEVTGTIVIDAAKGIKALYCGKEKRIRTYLFDKKKWTTAKAKAWIKEHKEKVSKAVHDTLETFEYLIHHIAVEGDKEIIHHCQMLDHLGNMFDQAHLWIDKGKVYLDGKEIKEGYYHVIKGLEPTQEVAWSEEEAIAAGIKPKEMIVGMTLKEKAKEW